MCGLFVRTVLVIAGFILVGCSDVEFDNIEVAPVNPQAPQPPQNKAVTESFMQVGEEPKLDILVIVDNSPSMRSEQRRLGQRLSAFTDQLDDVDWQIGITNTDVSNGVFGMQGHLIKYETGQSVLKKTDPDFKNMFLETVVRAKASECDPECPSTNEQPLRALELSLLHSLGPNYELFRNDADFAVIVISDEDEMSDGPSRATKPRKVLSVFEDIYPDKNMSVNGVIVEPGDSDCKDDQGFDGKYGTHVAEFASITNGITTSVCEEDYSAGLSAIGERARRLLNSVVISDDPKPGSVVVQFSPHHSTAYSVDGRKVLFEVPPPNGTEIIVSYDLKDEPIGPLEGDDKDDSDDDDDDGDDEDDD